MEYRNLCADVIKAIGVLTVYAEAQLVAADTLQSYGEDASELHTKFLELLSAVNVPWLGEYLVDDLAGALIPATEVG